MLFKNGGATPNSMMFQDQTPFNKLVSQQREKDDQRKDLQSLGSEMLSFARKSDGQASLRS